MGYFQTWFNNGDNSCCDHSCHIPHSIHVSNLDIFVGSFVDDPLHYRSNMVLNQLRPVVIAVILFTVLLGILYPLMVTGIAQIFFNPQANGSLITLNERVIGSVLIGQNFTSPNYFWGRPSTTSGSPYSAFDPEKQTGSSGSNLGPLSKKLVEDIQSRVNTTKHENPNVKRQIPVDLVTASGSGLDPNISLEAALYQVPRISQARGVSEENLIWIINRNIEYPYLDFLGQSYVNVLKLNLALDDLQ